MTSPASNGSPSCQRKFSRSFQVTQRPPGSSRPLSKVGHSEASTSTGLRSASNSNSGSRQRRAASHSRLPKPTCGFIVVTGIMETIWKWRAGFGGNGVAVGAGVRVGRDRVAVTAGSVGEGLGGPVVGESASVSVASGRSGENDVGVRSLALSSSSSPIGLHAAMRPAIAGLIEPRVSARSSRARREMSFAISLPVTPHLDSRSSSLSTRVYAPG